MIDIRVIEQLASYPVNKLHNALLPDINQVFGL
jgi:hypothetical protein